MSGKPDTKPEDLPDWFWNKTILLQQQPDFKYDTVYNFYNCQKCVITHSKDKLRLIKKRHSSFYSEDRYTKGKKIGQKKVVYKIVCDCDALRSFLTKFKICSGCFKQITGLRLRDGICYECLKIKRDMKSIPIIYFQNGKQISKPIEKIIIHDQCLNRNKCLEFTFKYGNSILHCGNCPNLAELF